MRGTDSAPVIYQIDVLRENYLAFQVYQHCQLGYVGGGMGALCIGLSASEVTAAMQTLDVPLKRRRRVLRDVIFMGAAAASWINEQNKKATD